MVRERTKSKHSFVTPKQGWRQPPLRQQHPLLPDLRLRLCFSCLLGEKHCPILWVPPLPDSTQSRTDPTSLGPPHTLQHRLQSPNKPSLTLSPPDTKLPMVYIHPPATLSKQQVAHSQECLPTGVCWGAWLVGINQGFPPGQKEPSLGVGGAGGPADLRAEGSYACSPAAPWGGLWNYQWGWTPSLPRDPAPLAGCGPANQGTWRDNKGQSQGWLGMKGWTWWMEGKLLGLYLMWNPVRTLGKGYPSSGWACRR